MKYEEDRLLSIAETVALLGIERTKFWKIRRDKKFPEPDMMLGPKSARWKRSTVLSYKGYL